MNDCELFFTPVTGKQVVKRSGSEREKRYAKKIEPLLARPHLLLVTLLVCNAVCAEVCVFWVFFFV